MMLKELEKQFLEYLEIEKNRSPKTIENYDRYLRRFISLSGVGRPVDITQDSVRNYRLKLNRLGVAPAGRRSVVNEPRSAGAGASPAGGRRELKKQTQFYHLIALRSFLKYLAKRDIKSLSPEKVELGKMPSRELDVIEPEELERLLNAPKGSTLGVLRDRALLELLFSTGLRVAELAKLNRGSVNLRRDEFSVRGKGDKIRLVFLSERAKDTLKKYLERREDIDEALFIRIKRGFAKSDEDLRLTPRSIQRLVKKYAARAGISKKITPHGLRHAFATDLLRNGADLRSVQQLLGHAQITTTQIYTHVTDKTLREVHKKYHSRNK